MSWGRADLNTRGHWLLELTVEGHVYRFSDQALEITDEDFSLTVTGFDIHRDLIVRIDEVETEEVETPNPATAEEAAT